MGVGGAGRAVPAAVGGLVAVAFAGVAMPVQTVPMPTLILGDGTVLPGLLTGFVATFPLSSYAM